jgi:hypothetical protein
MIKFEDFTMLDEAARKSLTRMSQHDTEGRNLGAVSAFRGNDAKEDMTNHKALGKDLSSLAKEHGYGFVPTKGVYEGGHERSYLVFGKKGDDGGHLRNELSKLGTKYGQKSIMHKSHDQDIAHLHGTTDGWQDLEGKERKAGESYPLGPLHFNRKQPYMTYLKGKRSMDYGS